MTILAILLYCVEKILQIKAKNADIVVVMLRLFNTDMQNFCNKIMDKLKRLWYNRCIWV